MSWESRFSDNSVISRALSFAISRKLAFVSKLREFDESLADISKSNVDCLLAIDSMDWPRLDSLKIRAMNDRAVNVAPHYLQVCRTRIGRIQRCQPDERFIHGDVRKALSFLSSSSSNIGAELKGVFFCTQLLANFKTTAAAAAWNRRRRC